MTNPDYQNPQGQRRESDRLKVFISYSRHDSRIAAEILGGLEFDGGFEALIDSHSIEEGEILCRTAPRSGHHAYGQDNVRCQFLSLRHPIEALA